MHTHLHTPKHTYTNLHYTHLHTGTYTYTPTYTPHPPTPQDGWKRSYEKKNVELWEMVHTYTLSFTHSLSHTLLHILSYSHAYTHATDGGGGCASD